MIKINPLVAFLILATSLSSNVPSYGMLKEIIKEAIWETLPYPRRAVCLCTAKSVASCKARISCAKLFLSPIKMKHKKETEQVRHLGLFKQETWYKVQDIGHIHFTYEAGRQGEIHNLYLDRDHRGKGFGYVLIRHALNDMDTHNVKTITLAVHNSNNEARGLYKKCGFFEHEKLLHGGLIMLRSHPGKKS